MLISKILCIFAQTIKGMRQWLQILTGIILLMAGGMIYLLFRPTTLLDSGSQMPSGSRPSSAGGARQWKHGSQLISSFTVCLTGSGLLPTSSSLTGYSQANRCDKDCAGPQPFHSSASLPNCCKRSASCPAHSTGSTSCAILCHTLFI